MGGSVPCFCFFLWVGGDDDDLCFKTHYDEALTQEVVYGK